jgi:hypothetical protein
MPIVYKSSKPDPFSESAVAHRARWRNINYGIGAAFGAAAGLETMLDTDVSYIAATLLAGTVMSSLGAVMNSHYNKGLRAIQATGVTLAAYALTFGFFLGVGAASEGLDSYDRWRNRSEQERAQEYQAHRERIEQQRQQEQFRRDWDRKLNNKREKTLWERIIE